MADEIVAKYRVDVQEASKNLTDLANAAKRTDDALKKSGQAATDSFNAGSNGAKRLQIELARQPKTLAEMELKLRNLKELLRDDTRIGTEGFKQVTKAIKDTEKAIDNANGKLAETKKQGTGLLGTFKNLAVTLGVAFGVQQIVSFAKEAVNLAAKAEGVERAFKRIGSPELLQDLRRATRGTVTDLELMQNSVKASNFKIPLEQLGRLFQFAQARARETGESVDYLVDSIILGIGRKSPLILDNLGISAVELRKRLKGVGVEAANVGDIAKIIGDIATEEMAKMGKQADTTADRLAQLAVVWNRFKSDSGTAIVEVATKLATLFSLIPEDIQRTNEYMDSLAGKSALALDKMGKAQLEAVLNAERAYKAALRAPNDGSGDDLQKEYFIQLDLLKVIQDTYKAKLESARGSDELDAITTDQLERELARLKLLAEQRQGDIKNVFYYTQAIKDLNEKINAEGTAIADIMPLLAQRAELQEELTRLTTEQATGMNLLNQELADMRKELASAEVGSLEFIEAIVKIQDKIKEIADAEAISLRFVVGEDDLNEEQKYRDAKDAILQSEYDKFKGIEQMRADHLANLDKSISDEIAAELDKIEKIEKAEKDERERQREARQEAYDENLKNVLLFLNSVLAINNSITSAIMAGHEQERVSLDNQLEAGQISREQYDQRRRQLEREKAADAKTAAIFNAVIGTAVAVVNALMVGPPQGYILAALSAALGAVEIGVIASQPLPQFAKGVIGLQGAGTETSDSIPARLSKGESVMTARETREHRPILEAIRKGTLERMIAETYVRPAVDSAMLSGFSDMSRSADLNGLTAKLSDHNIIAAMDRNRSATVYGLKMLADKLDKRAPKRGGYA
jgi:hypothetical protein